MAAVQYFPSFAQMMFTSTWIESILYGINCIMFGACIYILSGSQLPHWILFASCIFHIFVSTAHNIVAFIQVYTAYTNPSYAFNPNGPDIFLSTPDGLFVANLSLVLVNDIAQDLFLFWRLYIVLNRSWWQVVIPLLIIETGRIVCAVISIVYTSGSSNAPLFRHVQAFGDFNWSLHLIINTSVTCGIAYTLWRGGRNTSAISHTYLGAVWIIIESGALAATSVFVMFALGIVSSPAVFAAANVVVQVATMTPLLIIFRLGLEYNMKTPSSRDNEELCFVCPVRVTLPRTEDIECSSNPNSPRRSVESQSF